MDQNPVSNTTRRVWETFTHSIRRLEDWLKPKVKATEKSAIAQALAMFAAIAAFGGLVFTVVQIWVDLEDRKVERIAQHEERTARAKSDLYSRNTTPKDRGSAVNFLANSGTDLSKFELGCARKTGIFGPEPAVCSGLAFEGVDIGGDPHTDGQIDTSLINLEGAVIVNSDIRNWRFFEVNLRSAFVRRTRFDNVVLYGQLQSAWFDECAITRSVVELYPDAIRGFQITDCNISGTVVPLSAVFTSYNKDYTHHELENSQVPGLSNVPSYAWADMPPIIVDQQMVPDNQAYSEPSLIRKSTRYLEEQVILFEPPRDQAENYIAFENRPRNLCLRCGDAFGLKIMSLEEAQKTFPRAYRDFREEDSQAE